MFNIFSRYFGGGNRTAAEDLQAATPSRRPNSMPINQNLLCRCSSKDTPKTEKVQPQGLIPRSYPADASRLSFLDLPGELRNNVYYQALIFDNALRRMPRGNTKVPTLVLLRACKQIHEEAASIFYGGNTFYRYIEHTAVTSGVGAMFPSARYHIWLTRVTVDVKMWIYRPRNVTCYFRGEGGSKMMVKTSEEVVELVQTFNEMKKLWQGKEGQWEGTLRLYQERGAAWATICFFKSEETECGSIWVWKR